jgi:hypothetical protein
MISDVPGEYEAENDKTEATSSQYPYIDIEVRKYVP